MLGFLTTCSSDFLRAHALLVSLQLLLKSFLSLGASLDPGYRATVTRKWELSPEVGPRGFDQAWPKMSLPFVSLFLLLKGILLSQLQQWTTATKSSVPAAAALTYCCCCFFNIEIDR